MPSAPPNTPSPPAAPRKSVPPGSFDDSAAGEEDPGAGVDITHGKPPSSKPGKPYIPPPDA